MANDSIKVGTFGSTDGSANVPSTMVGKQIWYSQTHKYFVILNESNKVIANFGYDRYAKFVEAGVILYTNDGIKSFMDNVLNNWRMSTPQSNDDEYVDNGYRGEGYAYADVDDQSYDDQQDNYYDDSPQYDDYQQNDYQRYTNRRDGSLATDGGADLREAAKTKDPTKHIPLFFGVTLIIALAVAFILNFGQPILNAVAPLIS